MLTGVRPRMGRWIGLILGAIAWTSSARAQATDQDYIYTHENVLGTSLELCIRANSESAAQAAEDRALTEIDRLSRILSGYSPTSEFRRWQTTAGSPVRLSAELIELLGACDGWRDRSGGAFDPRVQALTDLWTRCAKADRLPADSELLEAKELMSRPAWKIDSANQTAARLTTCPLTLNSIGKGFIIGRACDAAMDRSRGITGVMVNIGGDVRVVGDVARTIGIAPAIGDSESAEPVAMVRVRDMSVATSGNSQRGFQIQGRWYSHIFDPHAGKPAERVISATVISAQAADANALATTLNVLPVERGLKLVASLSGFDCLIVTADGQAHTTPGWSRHVLAAPVPAGQGAAPARLAAAPPKGAAWSDRFELLVNFEIAGPEGGEGGRYRRPYVAVWVEDKDGLAVRTLALFISPRGQRWYPDLKRWYRDDQMRRLVDDTNLIDTVSRPTRPAGKYSATWDGKDDHGKSLPAGAYTVCIEAAREHGTYQIMRHEVTVGDKPSSAELKGNVEIKSASVQYRAKGAK